MKLLQRHHPVAGNRLTADGSQACTGVKGFEETGRSHSVADAEFDLVKAHAYFTVIDAMALALNAGQRPADVLKFKRSDIRDGALWIVQQTLGTAGHQPHGRTSSHHRQNQRTAKKRLQRAPYTT